jgi:hypothetical protein
MLKGIQNLSFLLLLSSLFMTSAFASSDSKISDRALKACTDLGGKPFVEREALVEDGDEIKECAKVRCSISSSGADGVTVSDVKASFPNASEVGGVIAGWKRSCKTKKRTSDDEFIVDVTGDVDGDVVVDGNGDGRVNVGGEFDYYIDGDLVSYAEFKDNCFRRNGKLRNKCKRRRRNSYDDYYNDGGGRRGGSGGGRYVVVRNSDGSTHKCYYTESWDHCTNGGASVIISAQGDMDGDCEDCRRRSGRGSNGTLSGIAEIAGAILPPLAHLGSNWLWADAHLGSNQAWAGAASVGFEQCQLMQTNHIQSMYGNGTTDMQGFFSNNELPYENIAPPGCNGYQLGGFAGGMGFQGNGFGGFGNPMMQAGYSPGFIGGMSGPWGMQNPYGSVNGMGGFGMGMGGPGIGINIGGGFGGPGGFGMGMPGMGMGGMNGGFGMGMGMPGMGMGGMNGGFGTPGINGGFGGGFGNGGFNGGLGGMYPGMGGTVGMGGNFGGGFGGMPGGGMYGNPWNGGGSMGMGTVPWGGNNGGYWNGSGGFGGGQGNFGNIQQSYQMNQQGLNMDSYLQQVALQNSYGQSAQNMSYGQGGGWGGWGGQWGGQGNYGYAPYSPGNMGLGLSMGFGFGF